MLCQATKRVFSLFSTFYNFYVAKSLCIVSVVDESHQFGGYYVLRICMSATFVSYPWPITQMVVSLAASMSIDIV